MITGEAVDSLPHGPGSCRRRVIESDRQYVLPPFPDAEPPTALPHAPEERKSVPLRTRRAEPWMAGGCDETAIASAEPGGVESVRRLSRQVRRSAVHAEKADPQVDPYRRAAHRRRPDAPGPRRAGPLAAPAGRGSAHGGRHRMARRPGRAGSPARTVASLVCPAHPGQP